jgi:hypothetical protein
MIVMLAIFINKRIRFGESNNFTLIAKNVTYCYLAVKEQMPTTKEEELWLFGAGIATDQFRRAGLISSRGLADAVETTYPDFLQFVSYIIVLEFVGTQKNISVKQIHEATVSKKAAIEKAIERAKKEFVYSNDLLITNAKLMASLYAAQRPTV